MTYTIEAEALTKSFGRTEALRGVDLAASPGTVLALGHAAPPGQHG